MQTIPQGSDSPHAASGKVPPFVIRLGLELAVVFIGVYAAFAMSQYEADKGASERRRQIQAALIREIGDLTSNTRRVATQLPVQLAAFDSAVDRGERPSLVPWIEPVRVQTHMWEATLQSGALDLLDVSTVYNLSLFYNELNAGFEQLSQLRSLSETVLIPNLGRDKSEFYEADGRQLRPKYKWYRDGLGRVASLATNITLLGDSLVTALAPRGSFGHSDN